MERKKAATAPRATTEPPTLCMAEAPLLLGRTPALAAPMGTAAPSVEEPSVAESVGDAPALAAGVSAASGATVRLEGYMSGTSNNLESKVQTTDLA